MYIYLWGHIKFALNNGYIPFHSANSNCDGVIISERFVLTTKPAIFSFIPAFRDWIKAIYNADNNKKKTTTYQYNFIFFQTIFYNWWKLKLKYSDFNFKIILIYMCNYNLKCFIKNQHEWKRNDSIWLLFIPFYAVSTIVIGLSFFQNARLTR